MKSYEAMQEAITGKTIEQAKRLHLSTSQVSKWQEPHTDFTDSGSYNPLDRIEAICQYALDLGVDRDNALSPIYWLNERFGLTAAFAQPVDGIDDLSTELVETLRDVGHLTTVASETLLAGEITHASAAAIEEKGNRLIRRVASFIKKTKDMTRKKFHLFRRKNV